MRPIGNTQSALRAPLNTILGKESHVRVLRALSLTTIPLARREILERTGLTPSGLPRVLAQLEDWGVIETVGSGTRRPVRLREGQRIGASLRQLFQEEARRADDVIQWLRNTLSMLVPPPASAWIEGSIATRTDRLHDPIVVGVLIDGGDAELLGVQLRPHLKHTQVTFDVAIEVHLTTRADLLARTPIELAQLEQVILLAGLRPLDLLGVGVPPIAQSPGAQNHETLDRRAKRIAEGIARYLTRNAELVPAALRHLERQLPTAAPGLRGTLQEWHDILSTYSSAKLRAFLVSDSERATRLRQSIPFAAVLPDDVREAIRRETFPEP